jgi:hypothetical protein
LTFAAAVGNIAALDPSLDRRVMPKLEGPQISREQERRYYWLALRIFADFGAVIAAPVVILAVVGKRADLALGTRPWLTVAGFVLAAAVSAVLARRRAVHYGRAYQALIDSEKK